MYSQNFFPLWGAWADKLLREKAPHAVKIEDLPGYDGGSETFKQALWEFEENGFAKVDYFSGVTLTPQAVSFFMANILREPTGNFRQVCHHLLDCLSRDGVDTSVAGLLEKAAQSRRFTGFPKLLGKSENNCF